MKPDIKGLLKLGRFLKRLPRQNFNQSYWFEEHKAERKEDCGTTGCVAGWAATLFPHRLKKLHQDTMVTEAGGEILMYDIVHRRTGETGSEAFAEAFNIPRYEADRITNAEAHRNSPKVAARSIFSLVNRLKKAAKKA
jgi:K+-transporting ATPase c subunit